MADEVNCIFPFPRMQDSRQFTSPFLKSHFNANISQNDFVFRNVESMSTVAVFMDLSKAFDCLNHDLLIANLEAYGSSRGAKQLIYSYLDRRKQRVEMDGSFSSWRKTSVGVPEGSILGPLLLNICLNDLFMVVKESKICNYADDTSIYVCDRKHEKIINNLENETLIVSEWFQNSCMEAKWR